MHRRSLLKSLLALPFAGLSSKLSFGSLAQPPVHHPIAHRIPEEVLLGLCGRNDFRGTQWEWERFMRHGTMQQKVRDVQMYQVRQNPLSKALNRLILNDRYPIFGREGRSYTRDVVGYTYKGGRRITIPTFEISTCPAVLGEVFRTRNTVELRKIFAESLTALYLCELDYFHYLLKYVTANPATCLYEPIQTTGPLTESLIVQAGKPMLADGFTPRCVFLHEADVAQPFGLSRMSILPISQRGTAYILGESKDGRLTNGIMVDAGFSFRFLEKPDEVVLLEQREKVGFLLSQVVRKIELVDTVVETTVREKNPRIKAFVIGEEGQSIVSVL